MSKNNRHFLVLVYASGVVTYHETSSPHMATKLTERVQKAIQRSQRTLELELGSNEWESVAFVSHLDQVIEVFKMGVDSLEELRERVGVMSNLTMIPSTTSSSHQEVNADE